MNSGHGSRREIQYYSFYTDQHNATLSVGPDLTTIRRQTGITREWLLKHIVNPNAEIAPYYRPQQLLTRDGKLLTGLIVEKGERK